MKNFELTNETIVNDFGVTLRRIKAVKDIIAPRFTVKAGELGGFVEKVDNLDGNAWVSGNARVGGNALVSDNACVYGNARVGGNAWVGGSALIGGNARVGGNAWVGGSALIGGNARVGGNAWVGDNADVFRTNHYLVVGPIGSRDDYTTFFRSNKGTIEVKCGFFRGTTDEFLAKVEKTHGDSKYAKAYRMATEMALAQIDMN